ncbi:MAG: hypothetical protein H7062_16210 [Candidatus Saccharimonas sp.]|nr:hypothetical protein [Planctomycetaceae bacterium]
MPTIKTRETIENARWPKPAPVEYAGQWVAWNHARTEIVAHGSNAMAVGEAADKAGHPDAILQKVRPLNATFIGAT